MMLLPVVLTVPARALNVSFEGQSPAIIIEGSDTLIFYAGDPVLVATENADWYDFRTGNSLQSNASTYYGADGQSVRLSTPYSNDTIGVYHLFNYSLHRPVVDSLTVALTCDATMLTIPDVPQNHLPAFNYYSLDGAERQFFIPLHIEMQNLTFASTAWIDTTETTDEFLTAGTYYLQPQLREEARILLDFDSIATQLGLNEEQVFYTIEDMPVAFDFKPQAIVTARGEEEENEPQRPITEAQYTASGPLSVEFRANPTPAAQYFRWVIYKGSTLIANRSDENQRYTFTEPATYRAVCYATNPYCLRDSVQLDNIVITASKLMVPNVFTPDGNGQNDEFRVLYKSLATFKCDVYNRWGKLVYSWTDPAEGWNGNIGGRPAAEGAYFYVIRAVGTDGIQYKLSGDINLLRKHSK